MTLHGWCDPRPALARRPAIVLRQAKLADVDDIAVLLARSVPHCVPEPRERLLRDRGAFWIAEAPGGELMAAAAIHVTSRGAADIRSVAVSEHFRGLGLGTTLVQQLIGSASRAGVTTIRCVSRTPEFFEALGFRRLDAAPPPRAGAAPDDSAPGPRVWLSLTLIPTVASATPLRPSEELAS